MDSKAKALDDLMNKAAQQRKADGPIAQRNPAREAKKALSQARGAAEAQGKLDGFFPPKAISSPKKSGEGRKGSGAGRWGEKGGENGGRSDSVEARRAREEAGERAPRPQSPLDMGGPAEGRANAAGLDGFFPASAMAGPKPRDEGAGRPGGRDASGKGGKGQWKGRGQSSGGGHGRSGSEERAGHGRRGASSGGRDPYANADPYSDSYADAYGHEGSDRELEQYGRNRWRDPSELTREEREALELPEAPAKPALAAEALPQLNASKDLMASFLRKHAGAASATEGSAAAGHCAGSGGDATGARAASPAAGDAAAPSKNSSSSQAGPKAPSAPGLAAGKNLMEEFLARQRAAEELTPEEKVQAILSAAPRADENARATRGSRASSDHHEDLLGEKTQWLRSGQSGADGAPGAGEAQNGAQNSDGEEDIFGGESAPAPAADARSARQIRKAEERARDKRNKKMMEEAEAAGESVRTSQLERKGPSVKPPLAPKEALQAARRKGVDLLARTDLPAQELIKRISRDERLAPYAAQAVEQLQALGLQSDERYAMGRARMRLWTRSAQFVRRELSDQGMPKELIEQAIEKGLESHHVESDTDLLAQAMARRFGPREPKFGSLRDKQTRWFLSRGYSFEQLRNVWAMARHGLLDQWASADFVDEPESEEEDKGGSSGRGFKKSAAPGDGAAASEGDGNADAKSKGRRNGMSKRGDLDETQLAELAQTRERKFGEDAPKDPRQRDKEKRWMSTRGATMSQIQEIWADAANNAELRLQAAPIEAAEPSMGDSGDAASSLSNVADPDADSGSGWSGSTFGDPKGGGEDAPDAFEQAWLKKYKGAAPDSAKEKNRQLGWAARHGGSYRELAELWERAKNGDFD